MSAICLHGMSNMPSRQSNTPLATLGCAFWRQHHLTGNFAALQVVELTDDSVLQQQCVQGSQRRTCFFAFLPALLDTQAAGRQKLIQVLDAMKVAGFRAQLVNRSHESVWIESACIPPASQGLRQACTV